MRVRKSIVLVLVLAVIVPGVLFAGGRREAAPEVEVEVAGRVAIVFATGGLGDRSFNDAAFRGMAMAAEELGIEFQQAEPTAIAEYDTFLSRFARTGDYDLIISIGFDQAEALTEVAGQYPDQKFAIVDMVVDKPNVASYVYKEPERGFLLGVIAAAMTVKDDDPRINPDRKVVGFVGGMEIPLIVANAAGYKAGVKYTNPEVDVLISYVGDWADPGRGKELAISQINQGADIIWGAAGRSGLGVILAAEEQNIFAMGADSDQQYEAPDNVLSSGMKYVDNTVFIAIQQVLDGTFQAGVNLLGVAEGGLGYVDTVLPGDVRAKVEAAEAKLISGEYQIPDTLDAVDAWVEARR